MQIWFTFTNSVDHHEMQHYAAFHLGHHCLQKYFGFPNVKGYKKVTADFKKNTLDPFFEGVKISPEVNVLRAFLRTTEA